MDRQDKERQPTGPTATHARARPWTSLLIPYVTIFASSFCVMVIELVAGRIIAGNLGSSLYTWTSVIGIVLAGLALGNHIGGRLADRFETKRTLATLFIAASAASLTISMADQFAGNLRILWSLQWPARVALHVTLAFFVPSCLLGMISPVVAKMALDVGQKTGQTIGNVYAWGVVGSILGTFATGFYLVSKFGTTNIIMGVAAVLASFAIFYQVGSWKTWTWLGSVALLCTLSVNSAEATRAITERLGLRRPIESDVLYWKESAYSKIRIVQSERDPTQHKMYLDTLLHSVIDTCDPLNLRYRYSKIFAAVTRRLHPEGESVDNLMIGGGGYVFPRYMEATYPRSRTQVVEIDPEVTKAATIAFGLPENTTIRSFHEDARAFVNRLREEKDAGSPVEPYDVVYVDAFNNHNVPFQLTTVEFANRVRELITPDGAYLVHLIDTFEGALFLGAMISTIEEVFPHVYVFVADAPVQRSPEKRNTFVIVGANQPLNTVDLDAECSFECEIFEFSQEERISVKEKAHHLILRDEFAPVESLLSAMAHTYAADRAFSDWLRSIESAAADENYERAIALARDALERFPNSPGLASDTANLLTDLGRTQHASGDAAAAIASLREALELDPSNLRARFLLINLYRDRGEIEASLPLFAEILEHDPQVRYNYATTLAQLGRHPEAIAQFRAVTEELPEFTDAYNNCGVALTRIGDVPGAVEQFERALELDPHHPDAKANLTRLLASLESEAS